MSIWLFLAVSLGINMAMFLVAYKRQTDKLTDISYALTFITIAIFGLLVSSVQAYHMLAMILVAVWAARLGGFLLYRIRKTGKDSRFDAMRSNFWTFGKFWLLQGVSVWVIMLAGSLVFLNPNMRLNVLSIVGIAVWAIGVLLEAFADMQKYRFTSNAQNKGKWIDEGLWHYSRHPNYLGEMLVWIGFYIFALPLLHGWQIWVGAISPLYIMSLLLFVSGIPILEKQADDRWGNKKEYQLYKRTTGLLIPKFKH